MLYELGYLGDPNHNNTSYWICVYLCAMATVSYGSGQKYVYLIIHHKRLKTDTYLFSIFSNIIVSCVKTRQICPKVQFLIFALRVLTYFSIISLVSFSCMFPQSNTLSSFITTNAILL